MSWCSSFLKLERTRPQLCIMNDLSLFISVSSVSQLSFPENKTLMEPPGSPGQLQGLARSRGCGEAGQMWHRDLS